MNIGFLSSNWTYAGVATKAHPHGDIRCLGASLYYRGALAASQLAARGYGGHVAERCRTNKDGSMSILAMDFEWHTPDVIWTELLSTEADLEVTRRAVAAGQIVIGDLDDDIWQVPKTNDAYALWATERRRTRWARTQIVFEQLRACHAIICSTEDLCHKARRLGRPVYLIRNAVDTSFITPHDPATLPVSWIGSTPWRAHDLHILRAAGLSGWLDANGQRFYHGGHMAPPPVPPAARILSADAHYIPDAGRPYPTLAEQAGLRHDQVTTLPNMPFAQYPGLWSGVGVSLVPLENVAFNRAKSWLKSLESCAAGVPYIVSDRFAEQQALIDEGTAGRVARNDKPGQWLAHLDELMDPDLRREEGRRNRAVAVANDITTRWVEWLAVIRDVVATAPLTLSTTAP